MVGQITTRSIIIFVILESALVGALFMMSGTPAWVYFALSGVLLIGLLAWDHWHRLPWSQAISRQTVPVITAALIGLYIAWHFGLATGEPLDNKLSHRLAISGLKAEIKESDGKRNAVISHVLNNKVNDTILFRVESLSVALGHKTKNFITMNKIWLETLPPNSDRLYIFPAIDVGDIWGKNAAMVATIVVRYRFENGNTYRLLRQTRTCNFDIMISSQETACPFTLDEDDQIVK